MSKESKKQKVQILKPCASWYRLGYNPGDVVELDEKQTEEMIKSGHAKKTTKKVGSHSSKEETTDDQEK